MTANRIDQNLTGKMVQQLQLSTGQLQSLEILALPQAALESFLTQEFAVNPVLEESPPPADIPDNSHEERPETPDDENDYEKNAGCADEWADELPLPGNSGSRRSRRRFREPGHRIPGYVRDHARSHKRLAQKPWSSPRKYDIIEAYTSQVP